MNKFTAILSICVQIGIDIWKQEYYTKVFDNTATIEEVLTWAKNYIPYAKINDIIFGAVSE